VEKLQSIAVARNTEFSPELIDQVAFSLMKIAISYESKSDWGAPIREVLQYDLGLPRDYISNNYLVNTFTSYLQDIFWVPNETIMDGIGQSITQVTPVAVARYLSAIINGGTVYDAQIVDKIIAADGRVVLEKEPVVANQIDTNPEYFTLLMRGMEDVTSAEDGGTAGKYFKEKEHLKIAAKTGTSQRTELDVENNAWMVAYAPYDDPKIAVVCYVQNGYSGAMVSQAVIDVIEYYLEDIASTEITSVGIENTIAD